MVRSLALVINTVVREVVVLGTGRSQIKRLHANVSALLIGQVFSDAGQTRLLPPVRGDSSGARGAAW